MSKRINPYIINVYQKYLRTRRRKGGNACPPRIAAEKIIKPLSTEGQK
jgi:hypothetical protein